MTRRGQTRRRARTTSPSRRNKIVFDICGLNPPNFSWDLVERCNSQQRDSTPPKAGRASPWPPAGKRSPLRDVSEQAQDLADAADAGAPNSFLGYQLGLYGLGVCVDDVFAAVEGESTTQKNGLPVKGKPRRRHKRGIAAAGQIVPGRSSAPPNFAWCGNDNRGGDTGTDAWAGAGDATSEGYKGKAVSMADQQAGEAQLGNRPQRRVRRPQPWSARDMTYTSTVPAVPMEVPAARGNAPPAPIPIALQDATRASQQTAPAPVSASENPQTVSSDDDDADEDRWPAQAPAPERKGDIRFLAGAPSSMVNRMQYILGPGRGRRHAAGIRHLYEAEWRRCVESTGIDQVHTVEHQAENREMESDSATLEQLDSQQNIENQTECHSMVYPQPKSRSKQKTQTKILPKPMFLPQPKPQPRARQRSQIDDEVRRVRHATSQVRMARDIIGQLAFGECEETIDCGQREQRAQSKGQEQEKRVAAPPPKIDAFDGGTGPKSLDQASTQQQSVPATPKQKPTLPEALFFVSMDASPGKPASEPTPVKDESQPAGLQGFFADSKRAQRAFNRGRTADGIECTDRQEGAAKRKAVSRADQRRRNRLELRQWLTSQRQERKIVPAQQEKQQERQHEENYRASDEELQKDLQNIAPVEPQDVSHEIEQAEQVDKNDAQKQPDHQVELQDVSHEIEQAEQVDKNDAQKQPDHQQTEQVVTIDGEGKIGMVLTGLSTHTVTDIINDSLAQKMNVECGSELIRVGDTEVRGMPHENCVELLAKAMRPLKLTFWRTHQTVVKADTDASICSEIDLDATIVRDDDDVVEPKDLSVAHDANINGDADMHFLLNAKKKIILQWLHRHADSSFLEEHRLRGSEAKVLKRHKKEELLSLAQSVVDMAVPVSTLAPAAVCASVTSTTSNSAAVLPPPPPTTQPTKIATTTCATAPEPTVPKAAEPTSPNFQLHGAQTSEADATKHVHLYPTVRQLLGSSKVPLTLMILGCARNRLQLHNTALKSGHGSGMWSSGTAASSGPKSTGLLPISQVGALRGLIKLVRSLGQTELGYMDAAELGVQTSAACGADNMGVIMGGGAGLDAASHFARRAMQALDNACNGDGVDGWIGGKKQPSVAASAPAAPHTQAQTRQYTRLRLSAELLLDLFGQQIHLVRSLCLANMKE